MFPDIIVQAGEIVEWILNEGGGQYRCKLNAETKLLVDELISVCNYSPFVVWSVMGSVGTKTAYFTIRAVAWRLPTIAPNNVIHVDFKARKVLSKAS